MLRSGNSANTEATENIHAVVKDHSLHSKQNQLLVPSLTLFGSEVIILENFHFLRQKSKFQMAVESFDTNKSMTLQDVLSKGRPYPLIPQ